jgi:hypothetical protein
MAKAPDYGSYIPDANDPVFVTQAKAAQLAKEQPLYASGQGTPIFNNPGGIDGYVQFNSASSFGGDVGFTYNNKTRSVNILGNLNVGGFLNSKFYTNFSNLRISGGSEGDVIFTDGEGNLSWGNLDNYTTNAELTARFTAFQQGNVNFTGANVSLGNVSNLHISGGSPNFILSTDGNGNLSWIEETGGGPNRFSIYNGTSNVAVPDTDGNVFVNVNDEYQWVYNTDGELLAGGQFVALQGELTAGAGYTFDETSRDTGMYSDSDGQLKFKANDKLVAFYTDNDVHLYTKSADYLTTYDWHLDRTGNLTLPTGGAINYSNGVSILSGLGGGGDSFDQSLNTDDDVTFGTVSSTTVNVSQINGTNPGDELIVQANGLNWTFGTEGNLTLPSNTARINYANGTNILDGLGGDGTGLSVTDFGEGFSLTASNKIVTNKLYSTNETQPTQHYRLELDTNGVVHLPDQSIINGATLKTVPGNYAGIAAGPDEAHSEDSWMWVDNDGAWIATDYSDNEYIWNFTNSGDLTLPNGGAIRTNYGYIDQDTDVNDNALRISGGSGVVINTDEDGKTWKFDNAGNLTLPSTTAAINYSNGTSILTGLGGGSNLGNLSVEDNVIVSSDSEAYINFDAGGGNNILALGTGDGALVKISTDDGATNFEFTASEGAGSIKFPDDTVQTTAYIGQEISPSVPRSDTAPVAANGQLWFNTLEGRMYIKYDGAWVDAAPLMTPAPELNPEFTSITFPDASVQTSAFPTKLVNGNREVVLNSNGSLLVAEDIILPQTGRIIKDCNNSGGTTSQRWVNIPTDTEVELIRAYTGDPDASGGLDVERAKISVEWQTPDKTGLSITAFDDGDEYKWEFNGDGTTQFPDGIIKAPPGDNTISMQSQNSKNFVTVSDGQVLITAENTTAYNWAFGTNGVLTLPLNSYVESSDANLKVGSQSNVIIRSNAAGGAGLKAWTFGTDGNITLPTNTSAINYANGQSILDGLGGGSSYGNSNVANYLPTHTGNVSAGNLSATGNITGNYIIGNGSQLTGLPASYANSNVATFLASYGSNTITTTGNVSANYFIGNGSQLTDITVSTATTAATVTTNAQPNITSVGTLSGLTVGPNSSIVLSGTSGYLKANSLQGHDGSQTIYLHYGEVGGAAGIATNLTVGTTGTGNLTANGTISATGNITGSYFLGNGSQLTGITATTAATVTTDAQPNITSVGTLSSLSVSGNITGGNLSTAGRVVSTGNIVTGGQIQSSAFTGGNISWSVNNQTDFQGAIKVGGTGIIKGPGGASSITLNNNGANIPIIGVTNTSNSTSTTTGALIVSGGAGIAGNVYVGGLVGVTGTIDGGNLTTGGQVSATGNVTGANLITAGLLTVTGNITGGNIRTAGVMSSTGNLTSGNILTGGLLSATGNITGGNLITSGLLTVAGNISAGGNIIGASSNVSLVAGSYTWTFDNTSNAAFPGNLSATSNIRSNASFIATNVSGTISIGNTNSFMMGIGNANYYVQSYVHNQSNTSEASADMIVYGSSGTDNLGFMDMGMTSNNFSSSFFTVTGKSEGYMFMSGVPGTSGNMVIATNSTGSNNSIEFYVGGFSSPKGSNRPLLVSNTGISVTGNITGNTNGFAIGYRDVPQVAASNATIGLTDAGKHFYSTTAGNFTLTIPNNATTTFSTGTAISIVVQAAGNILVNAASGVTLYMAGNSTAANRVVGTYGMATIMKVASDTWFINGTGVS